MKAKVLKFLRDDKQPELSPETTRDLLDWRLRIEKMTKEDQAKWARKLAKSPIAMPVTPSVSEDPFPADLDGFVTKKPKRRPSNVLPITVVPVFEHHLRTDLDLEPPVGLELEGFTAINTYQYVQNHFLDGAKKKAAEEQRAPSDFAGLKKHMEKKHLKKLDIQWRVILWVMPQLPGCSTRFQCTDCVDHLSLGAFVHPTSVTEGEPAVLMIAVDIRHVETEEEDKLGGRRIQEVEEGEDAPEAGDAPKDGDAPQDGADKDDAGDEDFQDE
jgi:hypothetical protein